MRPLSLHHPAVRIACCLLLLAMPAASLWNLTVGASHPSRAIKIGPKLAGVTREAPVDLSWASIKDGSFQRAAASRVTDAMAVRPLLIRINNEIRFGLFGDMTAPNMVRGLNGHLVERPYLDEYCSRTEGEAAELAKIIIPKLLDIQKYYRDRGGIFVYLITPSKAAHFPQYFLDHFPCPSSQAARTELVPQYVALLKQAGINVVDTATLTHALQSQYDFDLFPPGGEHWNDVGGARAAAAIVDEIDRQAGRELVPPFKFTYTVSGAAHGVEHDLADLLNVFFPPLGYLTPKLTFQPGASCATSPARSIDATMVGGSFSHLPGSMLIERDCLSKLNVYFYLRLGRFGGTPYRELQRNLGDADLERLRDASLMILEENESLIGRSSHVDGVRAIVTPR
jgi:hypothetical protein